MIKIFSIDDRIKQIVSTKNKYEKVKMLNQFDSKTLEKIRQPIMKYVGEFCHFCTNEITKEDTILPNIVYDSTQGHIAHGDCLNYCLKKHPDIPLSQLEGSIKKEKVDDIIHGLYKNN